ncbi:hypothetical protein P5P86_14385 [Nocardioides sp. BP30]|uniref:hypothetical protein n=1 Tax=Nocardioides sp. BP30 TaxID=3036374 RepID=UPI002469702E|nr:hypothetical protein [Nocardioides sp. BP30]WGL51146.1 hypothetical protein P5P86_14385 [Nocardioides sp. BP30]
MSRSADISTVTRRSAILGACAVATLVLLISGHIGWGILSAVATVGGGVVSAGSLGELRSGRARAAVAVPAVVALIALVAAF